MLKKTLTGSAWPHTFKLLCNMLFSRFTFLILWHSTFIECVFSSHNNQPDLVQASWIFICPLCPSATHNRYLTDKNTHARTHTYTSPRHQRTVWLESLQPQLTVCQSDWHRKTDVHTCLSHFFCFHMHSLSYARTHARTCTRAHTFPCLSATRFPCLWEQSAAVSIIRKYLLPQSRESCRRLASSEKRRDANSCGWAGPCVLTQKGGIFVCRKRTFTHVDLKQMASEPAEWLDAVGNVFGLYLFEVVKWILGKMLEFPSSFF